MSEPRQPVIVGGARTPVGRLLGSLTSKSASQLGGVAIAAALDRAGVAPGQVEYVIMGQVLQAGAGQITARQAAVAGTGVRLVDERPRHGSMGASIAFLHPADLGGVLTELVQSLA